MPADYLSLNWKVGVGTQCVLRVHLHKSSLNPHVLSRTREMVQRKDACEHPCRTSRIHSPFCRANAWKLEEKIWLRHFALRFACRSALCRQLGHMKWILNLDRRPQSCRLYSRSRAFFCSLYVTSSSESLAVYLTSCQSYTSGVPATGLACPTHTWSMRCLSLRHATPGAVVQQCLLRQKTLSPATFVCPRCSPRISPILHVL